jgi:type I restriction enzyme S subunit
MAKYQKYAEYKDSGVEWLGEIPRHWDSKPLKYLCTYNDEVLPETTAKDAEIQYIDIGSVSAVDGISKIETMIFKDAPSRARRIVRDGDVIVSTVRTYLEAIAPINNPPENLIVSTGFAVIRPNQYLYKSFASYCLRAKGFIKEVVARSVGVSYPAINSSDLVNITIPSIEYAEQVKIANFLDHETAKIDTLIAKQEKLIELLKEKRQAVISHAVTKGLNPDVTMKDSGVEWLGQVPEHWKVIKFGMTNRKAVLGGNYLSGGDEDGIPVIKMGNLGRGRINLSKVERLNVNDEFEEEHFLEKGDFLFNTRNSLDLVGKVSIWREELDKALYNSNILRISFYENLFSSEYVNYLFNSDLGLSQLGLIAKGTTSVAAIYYKDLRGLIFAYPPIEEQKQIVKILDETCIDLDKLIRKATLAIELIQERRTALISSAVTGKIDVRNWQHPNEAKTGLSS